VDTERRIMAAVVRADMFIVSAWRFALLALSLMGIGLLFYLARKKRIKNGGEVNGDQRQKAASNCAQSAGGGSRKGT